MPLGLFHSVQSWLPGVNKRGRATDVPVPLDLTSLKFLGKLVLVVPLLAALAAHLAEPGLLTKDKSKNQ